MLTFHLTRLNRVQLKNAKLPFSDSLLKLPNGRVSRRRKKMMVMNPSIVVPKSIQLLFKLKTRHKKILVMKIRPRKILIMNIGRVLPRLMRFRLILLIRLALFTVVVMLLYFLFMTVRVPIVVVRTTIQQSILKPVAPVNQRNFRNRVNGEKLTKKFGVRRRKFTVKSPGKPPT